jgi:hypothetical protein
VTQDGCNTVVILADWQYAGEHENIPVGCKMVSDPASQQAYTATGGSRRTNLQRGVNVRLIYHYLPYPHLRISGRVFLDNIHFPVDTFLPRPAFPMCLSPLTLGIESTRFEQPVYNPLYPHSCGMVRWKDASRKLLQPALNVLSAPCPDMPGTSNERTSPERLVCPSAPSNSSDWDRTSYKPIQAHLSLSFL